MTDLEMTKLCAQAMGWEAKESNPDSKGNVYIVRRTPMDHMQDVWTVFDPLHDDTQAMALVKKFRLMVHSPYWPDESLRIWKVSLNAPSGATFAENADLNRAIVECVARMRAGEAARSERSGDLEGKP